jgi:LysR family transcriptional regulator, glycine cleavage system transcriptional activator
VRHPPLRSISVFYHLARLKSVSKAAAELGVTPSAVSQQTRTLEQQLGTTLVVKVGREIGLTEAGERYFEMIAGDMENILDATRQLAGTQTTLMLNIRATPSISTKWLLPRLPQFVEANPRFDLRLDGTNEPVDFSRDDVDIEIRHGEGNWPGLYVQPLTDEYFVPVCSPRLARPASLNAAAIVAHRLIHSVKSQLQWKRWFQMQGIEVDGSWRKIYFDRSHMAVDAAVANLGIALESLLMMERELREGLLIFPVAPAPMFMLKTQWLVCPHHHLRRQTVRLFLDWIGGQATDWHASLDLTMFRQAKMKRNKS